MRSCRGGREREGGDGMRWRGAVAGADTRERGRCPVDAAGGGGRHTQEREGGRLARGWLGSLPYIIFF